MLGDPADLRRTVVIENIAPAVDGGRYAVKREVGDVEMTGERAARRFRQVVSPKRPGEIGVGFGREGEPRGPNREGRGDQRGQEELEEGDHASAPT